MIYGFNEQKCGICEKIIFPTPQWAYKRSCRDSHGNMKVTYYCSWSHFKEDEPIDGRRKNGKNKDDI